MARWQKGQSGNPGGRPKALHKVTELCRAETDANVRTLIDLRDDPEVPPNVRAFCAEKLLDRAWGKAPQTVDMTVNDNRAAEELSTSELQRIAAEGLGEKEVEH